MATTKGLATVDAIEQRWIAISPEDRPLALIRMIERSGPRDVFLVFCERRTDVDRLLLRMQRETFSVKALHGGYDQASRFRVMSAFRTGEVKVLLATDVAARGLDVEHVTHVVNYAVPREVESYTHRIGRTGRAGREGMATTFVTAEDRGRWKRVLGRVSWDIEEIDAPGPGGRGRGADRDGRSDRGRPERDRRDDRDAPEGRGRRDGRGDRGRGGRGGNDGDERAERGSASRSGAGAGSVPGHRRPARPARDESDPPGDEPRAGHGDRDRPRRRRRRGGRR